MRHRPANPAEREHWREHRRRRFRRHGRRAYIRSVYFLPSLATLGNAVCGFAAAYVATRDPSHPLSADPMTQAFAVHRFTVAAYLIFMAMVFDALDGRLARFARHTTDFGGQLDSLADMVSFGVAPAMVALQLVGNTLTTLPVYVSRLIWAAGALYMSCAAVRLARFNVSNEHGEQHHFSFFGLPSPGAAGTVAALILMQQDIAAEGLEHASAALGQMARVCVWILPLIVLITGLLMVSNIRYPHLVNRYLRGKRSVGRLVVMVAMVLVLVSAPHYAPAIATVFYTALGPVGVLWLRFRPRPPQPPAPVQLPPPSPTPT